MKTRKFKSNKQRLGDFFFRHVEKLFIGVACGLILPFIWFGFKTPIFDATTPRDMLSKTEQAEKYIHDVSHWNTLAEHRVADTESAKRIEGAKAIDPNTFSFRQICGTIVFTPEPRRDPALVPVKKFETRYFRAPVAELTDKKADAQLSLGSFTILPNSILKYPLDQQNESFMYRPGDLRKDNKIRLRTVHAVVGMALIDHEQQLTNFKENFQYQRGYDSARDVPEYALIEVQRKTDETEWEPITAHIYKISTFLAPAAKDLANADYLIPTIALPIPSFLGIDYRQFSLVDEIPVRDVLAEDATGQKSQDRDRDKDESIGQEEDPFGDNRNDSGSEETEENRSERSSSEKPEKEKIIPVRLVRFYDLTAKEVGKTYCYRLRVWLKDPNNPDAVNADISRLVEDETRGGIELGKGGNQVDGGSGGGQGGSDKNKGRMAEKKPLSEFDLSREVRDRIKYGGPEIPVDLHTKKPKLKELMENLRDGFRLATPTEWVEAAQPVTITADLETFVTGPIDAPPMIRFAGGVFTATEPSIKIVTNSFQDDLGVFVPAETETLRGSLLNYNAVTNVLDPLSRTIKEVFASTTSRGEKRGRRFKTDAVVLDIMGGQRQPFSRGTDVFFAPGECLIMDRNGRIHLHNDIDDTTAYRHAQFRQRQKHRSSGKSQRSWQK